MKERFSGAVLAVGVFLILALSCGRSAPCGAEPEVGPALAPETAEALDRMDAAGKTIKTLRAKFDYELNQTLYEDVQNRKGKLLFGAPNRLRFEFIDEPRETFIFDGRNLYHKKDATRQLVIWEVRLPDEPPVDSFELGKTPLPMPFGQKKEDVLRHFNVTRDKKEEAADEDKRIVLALVPKKGSQLAASYGRICLWVEAKTYLPTRARLWDTSENITTIDFHHIEMNPQVAEQDFERPGVPGDWEIVIHEKEPQASGTGSEGGL
ncbi:MAG TPA: outer membrane lipoprotein carrier protein LolA [Phycisphaerae bacterium]|nr:outer membrane lipoprotein carrier protein LolA [Phycisphaerae bacterium]